MWRGTVIIIIIIIIIISSSSSRPFTCSSIQWCSSKFGTVETLGSPLPLISLHSFPPFPPLFSPLFSYSPLSFLSRGNNFNDFPENQLTIDFAFLCKPAWGNTTVSLFPLVLVSFGGTAFPTKYLGERRSPQNIWGNGVPRVPLQLHNW